MHICFCDALEFEANGVIHPGILKTVLARMIGGIATGTSDEVHEAPIRAHRPRQRPVPASRT